MPSNPKILIKIHFSALTIAIFNFLFNELTPYSLEGIIELVVEITAILSGFLLFLFYFRPFKKINFYFSIYPMMVCIIIFAIIFKSLFWLIVVSIILFPLIPDQKKFEQDGIIISTPYQGFMAHCCSYQLKERKLLLFEKEYPIFNSEGPIDFETLKIEQSKNYFELIYKADFGEEIRYTKILK